MLCLGSLQEITVNNFFGETKRNFPKALGWNKKETKRKRILSKSNSNTGGAGLRSQTSIAYDDFLKKCQ